MPPSAKRSQKARRDARRDPSPPPIQDSSPSRPAKRRKKTQEPPPPAPELAEDDESLLTADQSGMNGNENDQLLSQVVPHLIAPKDAVQASKDHSNAIYEANQDGVKAYAKIAAQDWTYYITKLAVNIGRFSEPNAAEQANENQESAVHIDIGPSKTVSRQHASIYFSSKDEKWFLSVKGRNGAKIDGIQHKAGVARALVSGEVIEIGGVEMMFVLPTEISPLHIHPVYLKRAGLPASDAAPSSQSTSTALTVSARSHGPVSSTAASGSKPPQAIAPAPPDYKRPGTPPSAKRRTALASSKTPQHGNPLLVSNSEVDLSLDDNKHIKPQYSYSQMITQAIMSTPDEKLNLNGIYNFITTNYAYYRHQQAAGWQNSIRHNLSLNKAFDKVARSNDEPGKGMKWQIVTESRDEMVRSAYKGGRGGHRGSSAPSSPSQLNYVTQGPRDMAARDTGSGRKRKASPAGSPQPSSALRASQSTPNRGSTGGAGKSFLGADDSPLPRSRRGLASTSTAALSSQQSDFQPQSPTLTASYLQEDSGSFVTPAPHRVHPKFAPPSTAQRPSQHMPTSSPAPFWKYAEFGSTPLRPAGSHFDLSPSKSKEGGLPESSSPSRGGDNKSPATSPSRPRTQDAKEVGFTVEEEEEEEEQGFDLTKGFQSIGSYHAPVGRGLPVAPAVNGHQ